MSVVVDNMELEKYYHTIALKEIGEEGQRKLLSSKVLVVGAGGLASSVLLYLATSGVGVIGVIDDDVVSLSNLPRQVLFSEREIGRSKALVIKERLEHINKDVKVNAYNQRLTEDNGSTIKDYDLILDCVDNFETKFLINDLCVRFNKPFITAGVSDYKGQVLSFIPGKSKRDFKSLFSELPINIPDEYKKGDEGVFPPAVGLIGNIQTSEALKYLLGIEELLVDQMLVVDTLSWNIKKIKLVF